MLMNLRKAINVIRTLNLYYNCNLLNLMSMCSARLPVLKSPLSQMDNEIKPNKTKCENEAEEQQKPSMIENGADLM